MNVDVKVGYTTKLDEPYLQNKINSMVKNNDKIINFQITPFSIIGGKIQEYAIILICEK